MEFWGVEVKAGEKLKVQPEFGQLIHISQASLGEVKDVKGAKNVPLRLKIDNKAFVIGYLSADDRPQVMFDLVLEKEFELSHDLKNGSISFIGYVAEDSFSDDELPSDDDESEDELALEAPVNGVVTKDKDGAVKPSENAVAAKGAKDKAKKEEEQDSDDDDDDSESDSDDDEMALDGQPQIDSSDVSEDDSEDEDEDEDEDESEEELPTVQASKKRPAGSAEKTPMAKKAKSSTPDNTGKKSQNATPAPSKSAGKTPNKSNGQTPKSGSQVSCKSCSKSFSSESALQSHAKAKHGGK